MNICIFWTGFLLFSFLNNELYWTGTVKSASRGKVQPDQYGGGYGGGGGASGCSPGCCMAAPGYGGCSKCGPGYGGCSRCC